MLTLGQLRTWCAMQDRGNDHIEVKVWLPGSTISLEFNNGKAIYINKGNKNIMMIEGNLDAGSALRGDIDN